MPTKKSVRLPKQKRIKTRKESGFQRWYRVFKDTSIKWMNDDPFRQSSVIAYYAIFSLPSLLLIIIGIAGYFFGHDTISNKVLNTISNYLGKDAADQVQTMIVKSALGNKPWYSMIIGIVTMLTGAVGVFTELQQTLNYIWEVKPKPDQKFIKTVKDNLFSFGLILSIGFLMLISLVLTALITAISSWMSIYFSVIGSILLHVFDFAISFGIVTILFALIFKILPDIKVKWKYIWSGSLLTAFLFVIGKYALGVYFGKFQPASAYGIAGTIVLILLWFSYSSMILFYGAEFTKQLTLKSEGKIIPAEGAITNIPDSTNRIKTSTTGSD